MCISNDVFIPRFCHENKNCCELLLAGRSPCFAWSMQWLRWLYWRRAVIRIWFFVFVPVFVPVVVAAVVAIFGRLFSSVNWRSVFWTPSLRCKAQSSTTIRWCRRLRTLKGRPVTSPKRCAAGLRPLFVGLSGELSEGLGVHQELLPRVSLFPLFDVIYRGSMPSTT